VGKTKRKKNLKDKIIIALISAVALIITALIKTFGQFLETHFSKEHPTNEIKVIININKDIIDDKKSKPKTMMIIIDQQIKGTLSK
jgi:hypothetical protein